MPIYILCEDPRARLVDGVELGTIRTIQRGEPRRPWPCFVVQKPKGGTARARKEVAHG